LIIDKRQTEKNIYYQTSNLCLQQFFQARFLSEKLQEILKHKIHQNLLLKSGMHNIRPACQMWPTEAFNLARKTPNSVYFASFFGKNTL